MSNKYLNLIKLSTNYATRMNRLSNKIFTEVVRPTDKSSMRVVNLFARKPDHLREEVVDYYPRHEETYYLMKHLRDYGLFRDEHEDFNEEMKRLRTLRGKGRREKKPKS